jgi:nickel transport protein
MTRLTITICICTILTLCLPAVSSAHRVNVFAYVDGNTVVTDSGYSRSKRVQDGTIEVYDTASGIMLLSGATDKNGKFSFEIPAKARDGKMDLRLRLKAGAGHQAEWTVKYSEYKANKEQFTPTTSTQVDTTVATSDSEKSTKAQSVNVSDVETVVHRELEPVKRMLATLSQTGPGVTEIIGGIGYILGLFGIIAYMKSRKK